jgi:hypothetical protein
MLALGLISGCALPLIRGPLLHIKAQQSAREDLELFFLSEKALSEVKQALYQHQIPWREIAAAQKKPIDLGEKKILAAEAIFLEKREICSCLIKKDRQGHKWAKIHLEIAYFKKNKKKALKKYKHALVLCQKEENLLN